MTAVRRLVVFVVVALLVGCSGKAAAPDQGPPLVALSITSTPSSAAVLEDGRDRLGKTPLTLRRQPGASIELHVVKDGYEIARRRVLLEPRPRQGLFVQLQLQTAILEVQTGFVHGARIVVDGVDRGRAPDRVTVALGPHRVEVRRRGVATFVQQVVARRSGETIKIVAKFERPPTDEKTFGYLTVLSDRRAVVTAGEALLGTTPLLDKLVPPRRYELTLEALDTREKQRATVTVVTKRHAKVRVRFGKRR